jgi:hypothetical protein
MDVDQARRHQRFAAVDDSVARLRERAGRANRCDRVAFDADGGGGQKAVARVDGEDGGVAEDGCHVSPAARAWMLAPASSAGGRTRRDASGRG